MAKALSPTKTASRLSPTKPTQAQAQAAPDGSGAPQPSDVVQLASSMMDRIMRGGGLPARSGSARQAGAPARPSFGTTNKPVRPHTAHTTGRMSAIRITGEDGAHPRWSSAVCDVAPGESAVRCVSLHTWLDGNLPSYEGISRGYVPLLLGRGKPVHSQRKNALNAHASAYMPPES
jgi:hypothetical protein